MIGLSPVTVSCIHRLIALGYRRILYSFRIVGSITIFDSSLVSDEDIRLCYEFMDCDKDKSKIDVLRDFFVKSFPTLLLNQYSDSSTPFSIIICDTTKECFTTYSSLYSYSSNIFFIEYSNSNVNLRLLSQCINSGYFIIKPCYLIRILNSMNTTKKKYTSIQQQINGNGMVVLIVLLKYILIKCAFRWIMRQLCSSHPFLLRSVVK